MKGVGLGVRFRVEFFFVMGSQDKEYWLGPGGELHKTPLDMGLDILQILLMSCLTPCMVNEIGHSR
jgi:hypothetical protein